MILKLNKTEKPVGGVVEWLKALVFKISLRSSYISSLENNLSYNYELVTKKINTI